MCDGWSTTACRLAKQLLCTDTYGCCAGKYSPTAGLAVGADFSNAVEYNGLLYRTLDGTSPLDTSTRCQNYYLGLPSGWALAADNADSLAVIVKYQWGTQVLTVAGGRGYYTAWYAVNGGSAGSYCCSYLSTSGSTYKVDACNILILISKAGSACTACPAGESEIAGGRECGAHMCV